MRIAIALLVVSLGCSSAPEPSPEPSPEPLPTPIVVTPYSSKVVINSEPFWGRKSSFYLDPETKVGVAPFLGPRYPGDPEGPDLYINFYFSGEWKKGQVTLDDVERTLIAAYSDSVLSAIPSPPNDRNGHYYIVLLPSPRPRAHSLSLMRVDVDGPDVLNFTLVVNFWGDADQRRALQRAWVRDSSARWALELGRVKLDPRWREWMLTLNDSTRW